MSEENRKSGRVTIPTDVDVVPEDPGDTQALGRGRHP